MDRTTPLAALHRENGARFGNDQEWTLPLQFGNVLDEYRAVRSGVGLIDLCRQTLLRFTGTDRVSFLQGMVSNDVARLSPGQGILAAFTDIQGKVIADIKIFGAGDSFFIELGEPVKDKVLGHLAHYLIADDVEIADMTGAYGILALLGPKSTDLLRLLLGGQDLPAKALSHGEFQTDPHRIRVIRVPRPGAGYEVWAAAGELAVLARWIQENGRVYGARWVGTEAQEILRVEAGIPRYGVDMDEENLLLETGMDDAVSFNKGCYLGQEVIERIHSRGHVNRKLTGLVLEGDEPAQRGDRIQAQDREVGKVTSAVFSPLLHCPIAMGYVQRDFLTPGTRLVVCRQASLIPSIVVSLPFKP